MSTTPDRSVGFKLDRGAFSLSTTLSDPASIGATRNAELRWRLAQPAGRAKAASGVSAEKLALRQSRADRRGLDRLPAGAVPHLTLTSQLTMGGTYVFAPGDGIHTAMT
jgi:hypothetical protein